MDVDKKIGKIRKMRKPASIVKHHIQLSFDYYWNLKKHAELSVIYVGFTGSGLRLFSSGDILLL
jgi:hypothetical protein